jgi:outer membrane protein assembly factor BamE (lipoprotein component of BamABCDE complex)
VEYRALLIAPVLALGVAGLAGLSRADVIATDTGIAVKESDVATPRRGMSMDQVASKFGAPVTKVPAVGKPAISRWEYPGYVVYFENDHVIHSVVAANAPPETSAPAGVTSAPGPDSSAAASDASAPAADASAPAVDASSAAAAPAANATASNATASN